jgi:hypothetical protein
MLNLGLEHPASPEWPLFGSGGNWRLVADSTLSASLPVAAHRYEFKNLAPINSKKPIMETREHPHREA